MQQIDKIIILLATTCITLFLTIVFIAWNQPDSIKVMLWVPCLVAAIGVFFGVSIKMISDALEEETSSNIS